MKRQSILLWLVVIMPVHWATSLRAQVPGIINYQGRVSVNGTNFNGTGSFRFALVNGAAATTNYWSNDGSPVGQPIKAVPLSVTKGLYSVLLGDTTVSNMTVAIPSAIFGNSDVRLRVWFNDGVTGIQQLSPDQRLAAVGYALMAANVPVGAIGTAQLASNAVTAANIAPGAVTTVAIANGAVGANQLASNSVNSLIESNLTTMGVLTTNTPQYWASNQYYLACGYLSTNATAGSGYGGVDLVTLVLAESADGINFSLLSGIDPTLNNGGASAVNVANMWTTNGTMFYTWEKNADFPTNVIPIASAPGFALPPTRIATIDCSSIGCTGALGWIQGGNVDFTPGAIVSNLFVSLSVDGLQSRSLWMLTCTNLPYYTEWTQPRRIPILGGTFGLTNYCQGPVAFTYHGTNMLIYYDQTIYSNDATSIIIATNTTAPGQAYAIWKSWDWGGWTTNGYSNGVVRYVEFPCPVFLPDRIRLYFEGTFTNLIFGGDAGIRFCYSDCFDDWTTWTPLRQCSLNLSNYFLRTVTVLPVPSSSELQNSIGSRLGLYSPTNFTSGASVAGGLTADTATMTTATMTGLTVSNNLRFGRLVHVPWITTNALNILTGSTNFTVFADTTANAVSNVFGLVSTITGGMLFFSNIGTSTNTFTIDFGSTSTLTNNSSRYLSLAPMQHILMQKITANAWASLGDNVFAGMTITNAPAVTLTNHTWGLVIGSDGKQYRVPLYK